MNTQTQAPPPREFRLFLELFLVLGLPVAAIFISSALAIAAYTKGFTPLPEAAAATIHPG